MSADTTDDDAPIGGSAPTGAAAATAGSAPALELRGVVKRFGKTVTAVDGLDLALAPGAIHGFLGPNGAGKTTTIRMIMNILTPDAGEVRVLGAPMDEEVKNRIGYLPEERGLYKKMKVLETVLFFAALKGFTGRPARDEAMRWLERLDLADRAGDRVEGLSKGMSQKLQFACTILHQPDLLVLDEPFSGLDPVATDMLRELIHEYRAGGRTVLFSTHVMHQAEELCDTVTLIHRGRAVVHGPLQQVLEERTERALVVEPRLDGEDAAGDPWTELADRVAALPAVTFVRPGPPGSPPHARQLDLADDAAPADVMRDLLDTDTAWRRLEIKRPSLHEVFKRSVGMTVDEAALDDEERPEMRPETGP